MTGNAIRCHIKGLKKKAGINGTPPNSAPVTTNKPFNGANASAGDTPKRSLPARKRAKPIVESGTDTEDDDFELQASPPPPKKIRRKSSVKEEQGIHDENGTEDTV